MVVFSDLVATSVETTTAEVEDEEEDKASSIEDLNLASRWAVVAGNTSLVVVEILGEVLAEAPTPVVDIDDDEDDRENEVIEEGEAAVPDDSLLSSVLPSVVANDRFGPPDVKQSEDSVSGLLSIFGFEDFNCLIVVSLSLSLGGVARYFLTRNPES